MKIAITNLRQTLCEVLNKVHYGQKAILVTKREKPFVVILPVVGVLNQHTNIAELITALATPTEQEASEDKTE